jgi:hypothetical protein
MCIALIFRVLKWYIVIDLGGGGGRTLIEMMRLQNNMAVVRNFSFAFGLVAVTNKLLKIGT